MLPVLVLWKCWRYFFLFQSNSLFFHCPLIPVSPSYHPLIVLPPPPPVPLLSLSLSLILISIYHSQPLPHFYHLFVCPLILSLFRSVRSDILLAGWKRELLIGFEMWWKEDSGERWYRERKPENSKPADAWRGCRHVFKGQIKRNSATLPEEHVLLLRHSFFSTQETWRLLHLFWC